MPAKRTVVPFPSSPSAYTIEKFKRRNWAVKKGAELITVTVYKKGATAVVKLLDELEALRRTVQGLRLISDLVIEKKRSSHA